MLMLPSRTLSDAREAPNGAEVEVLSLWLWRPLLNADTLGRRAMPYSAANRQRVLSNGIAELMYVTVALATDSGRPFAERHATALEMIDDLCVWMRSQAVGDPIEGAPLVQALQHLAALRESLSTSVADQPLPVEAEEAFGRLLAALDVTPRPTFRELIAAQIRAQGNP